MNSTRLKQIEEIYHAAADSSPIDRVAFVRAECGEDENLRREVESLLSYEEVSDSFIDSSPDAIAAEMFSEPDDLPALIGKTIGRYSIKKLLGLGGMGEVYLADDSLLNRKVALKLLPPGLIEHRDHLKRFKQEAQAASALNHPNILTIHEFGTENGSNYIVTEFVDGVTLRQRMRESRISVIDTLDVALQIASALGAAHEAGIIHRDIKPENVMIRRDGIVKVLDFGLAKLMMPTGPDLEAGGEAQTFFKTAPGIVMGTTGYMSPEQARGVKVDGRTDIWSLGVVIYEMVAAHLPFRGATQTDVLVAILNQSVPAFENLGTDAPAEIKQIVDKALTKDVEVRYQDIAELAADLKSCKKRLEFEAELAKSQSARPAIDTQPPREAVTQMIPAAVVGPPIQRDRSEESKTDSGDKNKSRPFALMSIIALVVLAGVVGAYVWQSKSFDTSGQPAAPMNAPTVPDTAAAKPSRILTYSLTVQSFTDGRYKNPFQLSGEMLFRNRDRVRLNIQSPQAGYLYILNQGPKGDNGDASFNILFPSPATNDGSAMLSADQKIQIPAQSWFELDTKEGTELIWLVWSENAIQELESAKRFANARDRGKIQDAELIGSIESLLRKHQSRIADVEKDDNKKESRITANADILAHTIKLEHQ